MSESKLIVINTAGPTVPSILEIDKTSGGHNKGLYSAAVSLIVSGKQPLTCSAELRNLNVEIDFH